MGTFFAGVFRAPMTSVFMVFEVSASYVIILPVMIAVYVVQEPNATLSVVLSLIPFFTPTMMSMRVVFLAPTLESYSIFSGIIAEATIGFILVVLTVIGMIWLTSKIFRIGILMYGKRPTFPEIVKWVKY